MNIDTFNQKRNEYGIEGDGYQTITTKDKNWHDKETKEISFTIPSGSKILIYFMPQKHPSKMFIQYGNDVKLANVAHGSQWIRGFKKAPSINTLEKNQLNGVSKSVLGDVVEPDGWGPTGAPSWELVIGII